MDSPAASEMAQLIKARYVGCILGGLVGDALGAPWEFVNIFGLPLVAGLYMNELLRKPVLELRRYTDDTALTISVISSLVNYPSFYAPDLAKRLTSTYFDNPKRGYGAAIIKVFYNLRESFEDVFKPASLQFEGAGSLGNGGAMRISPMALRAWESDSTSMVNDAIDNCRITHKNPSGIAGALFQVFATKIAFITGVKRAIATEDLQNSTVRSAILAEIKGFLQDTNEGKHLREDLKPFVEGKMGEYLDAVNTIGSLVEKGNANVSFDEIRKSLGTEVTAARSVPTALYCFLASFDEFPEVEAASHFQRTIQLAISLGGDTDTIASMAGSIAGAYLGVEGISSQLIRHCEDHESIKSLAGELYEIYKDSALRHISSLIEVPSGKL